MSSAGDGLVTGVCGRGWRGYETHRAGKRRRSWGWGYPHRD